MYKPTSNRDLQTNKISSILNSANNSNNNSLDIYENEISLIDTKENNENQRIVPGSLRVNVNSLYALDSENINSFSTSKDASLPITPTHSNSLPMSPTNFLNKSPKSFINNLCNPTPIPISPNLKPEFLSYHSQNDPYLKMNKQQHQQHQNSQTNNVNNYQNGLKSLDTSNINFTLQLQKNVQIPTISSQPFKKLPSSDLNNNNHHYQKNNVNTNLSNNIEQIENVYFKSGKIKRETHQFEQIPLFIACFHNNINSLKTMIKFGTDMNYQCKNKGWTPLMFACQEGNLEIVVLILNVENVNVNIRNFLGNTALMISCYNSRKDIIKKLLESNSDSNITNKEGSSPLMVSSALGNLKIMSLLIRFRANVNLVDNRGYPALMYSQLYGTRPSHQTSTNGNEYFDTRYDSIIDDEQDNRKHAINILLDAGSRIDHVSKDGFDPLKLSIKHGPFNFVHYLLDRLIDPSVLLVLDTQGWSPLKLAMRYSSFPIILLLLKKLNNFNLKHMKNKDNFILECLIFLIQCHRDIEIFIKTFEYFCHIYQTHLEISSIEILIDQCREMTQLPVKDFLLYQYNNQYNQQQQPILLNNNNNIQKNNNYLAYNHHQPTKSYRK